MNDTDFNPLLIRDLSENRVIMIDNSEYPRNDTTLRLLYKYCNMPYFSNQDDYYVWVPTIKVWRCMPLESILSSFKIYTIYYTDNILTKFEEINEC